MATFFARRYMRKLEEVGRTEKVVGLLLILLIVAIVTAFIVQATTDRNYLFNVDPSAYEARNPPRERLVAERMLPPPEDPGWRSAGPAEAIHGSAAGDVLGTPDDERYEVQWVYRRRYETTTDPPGTITVLVCDAGSPDKAFKLSQSRRPSDSAPIRAGQGGWSSADEQRTGFWKGRYYTELRAAVSAATDANTGPRAPDVSPIMRLIAGKQLAYGTPSDVEAAGDEATQGESTRNEGLQSGRPSTDADRAQPASNSSNPFPEPGVAGWRAPRKVARFTPDTLYVKIDGRVGVYLQFHVAGLTFGTYFHQNDPERTIDVYWYDMGEPQNAFGIYRAEASPGATPLSIGHDAYQTGGAVFFWKGASYVQLLPTGADEADAAAARAIAARMAGRIQDTGAGVWALDVLPQADRVPESFAYTARDAFSLGFLDDVFTADYNADGGRITLFIHRADDASSARALLDQYVVFFEKFGRIVWRDENASRGAVAGEVSGVVDVVFAKGRYLGGVAGADDVGPARTAALAFYDQLKAP